MTPAEALEILTKALDICDKAGIPTSTAPLYHAGETSTIIVLKQTEAVAGRLTYTGNPPPAAD